MHGSTLVVGSLDALRDVLDDGRTLATPVDDVVIVPTAAAFLGAAEAAIAASGALSGLGARVETLMVTDRASSHEDYFARRITEAGLVVLCDGSALHARTVWRDTPVGAAIDAASWLVVVGAVATVLGESMVDPRGGAPTTGLGYRPGVVFCPPASAVQLARTRLLLGADATLVVLGPAGVLLGDERGWHVVAGGVEVTRGADEVAL